MDELRLEARRAGTTLTIEVAGELDMATKPQLIAFLDRTLRDGDKCVSLDLAGLTFIDAGGIGALVGLRNRTRGQSADLVMINSPNRVKRLLRVTGLDEHLRPRVS